MPHRAAGQQHIVDGTDADMLVNVSALIVSTLSPVINHAGFRLTCHDTCNQVPSQGLLSYLSKQSCHNHLSHVSCTVELHIMNNQQCE